MTVRGATPEADPDPASDPAGESAATGPLLGEPLPVELANTTHAVRGRVRDGLRTADQLARWLRGVGDRLPFPLTDADLHSVTPDQLAAARELRDTLRELAAAAVAGAVPAPEAVDRLNRHVRTAPAWRELRWTAGTPRTAVVGDAPPVTAVLSAVAQAAVDLFAGPRSADLRACHAPGCVLFFVKDHPRRAWCSAGCGNRARAARHYARTRTA